MSKSKSPEWILSDDWAVNRDPLNWVLYTHKGNRWRPTSFYPTLQMLLESLHEKIARTMPAETTLQAHILSAHSVATGCASRLSEHIHVTLQGHAKLSPQTAYTTLNKGADHHAS